MSEHYRDGECGGYEGGGTTYSYDGDGHRVRKVVGTVATVFVYDAAGRLVAEYSNQVETRGTRYLTQDHLGSTRAVTDKDGAVSRHDYLPFGEEVPGDSTWRTWERGYKADAVRQKFTGKERDAETGLDYFGARYYSASQGRFTSSDPVIGSQEHIADPQRWNQFAYVENDPLRLVDPNGEDGAGQDGKKTITVFLNYHKREIETEINRKTGERVKTDEPNPDWGALAESAKNYGYEVKIVNTEGSRIALPYEGDFREAGKNSDLIVVAGHAGTVGGTGEKFIPLGSMTAIGNPATDLAVPPEMNKTEIVFNGSAVAFFGCNSDKLPSGATFAASNPQASFVGVQDEDGYFVDSVPANNWAGYKFVEAYMKSKGDVGIAAAAAQKVYKQSNNTMTVNGNGVFVDKKDKVNVRHIE